MPNIYTLLLVIYVRSIHYENRRFVCFHLFYNGKFIPNLSKFGPESSPPRRQHNQKACNVQLSRAYATLHFLIIVVEGNFQVSS